MSLSSAAERHPKVFGDLYVSIVRAGEATGRVDRALDDLVQQLEWQEATRTRVQEAAAYPILIIGLLAVLLTVLIGFTIPRFARVRERERESPAAASDPRGAGGGHLHRGQRPRDPRGPRRPTCSTGFAQAPGGPEWRDRWLLKLPVVGDVSRKLALSRFAHFFGSLHESGVEVAPSLAVIERVIGNAHIARRFRSATSRVLAGDPLSRALGAVGEFSPLVIQMVALGEKTGQMSKSLQQVRQYYDREADRAVSRAIGVFGPAALLALAGVFVLIAVAFYLPDLQPPAIGR
jgi:type IV pilus assembly protein PilC